MIGPEASIRAEGREDSKVLFAWSGGCLGPKTWVGPQFSPPSQLAVITGVPVEGGLGWLRRMRLMAPQPPAKSVVQRMAESILRNPSNTRARRGSLAGLENAYNTLANWLGEPGAHPSLERPLGPGPQRRCGCWTPENPIRTRIARQGT